MSQLPIDQKIAARRRFTRFFARRIAPLEAGPPGSAYSATEVRVLTELALHEPRTLTSLSRSLGLDGGYLSRVIRRLETTGIVFKSADATDSRQQPMSLTDAGRAEVRTIETITTARFAALVRTLPPHSHAPLLDAMERIEAAFGADAPPRDVAPYLLRPHRSGDVSFAAQRSIASAREEFDIGGAFESLTLGIAARFLERFNVESDCGWMAEREGTVVGSVLVRRVDAKTAELAMLHVDSGARGIGIGRRLIAEAIEFARRAGYRSIQLELWDVMKTARVLFHAAGFRHLRDASDARFGKPMQRRLWNLTL